jgi:tRNA/rRNA methyltransferase
MVLRTLATSEASRVRFVLVEPSHPGNIGAAARAIRTMGFTRLAVVAPKDALYRSHPDAIAFATGAGDVLEQSTAHATLTEALGGVTTAVAMSGYDREFGPPLVDLRTCAAQIAGRLPDGEEIALVFGTERSGLTNDDILRCQVCCAIPADPGFPSLNLAQAVQVAAYELPLALQDGAPPIAGQRRFGQEELPAPVQALEALYAHLERALITVGAHDPAEPKRLMQRLRRLLNRARPTQTEVDVLRGVIAAIIESRSDRAGRKSGR